MGSRSHEDIDSLTDKLQLLFNNERLFSVEKKKQLMPLERQNGQLKVQINESDVLNQKKIMDNVDLIRQIHEQIDKLVAQEENIKLRKKSVGFVVCVAFVFYFWKGNIYQKLSDRLL